MSLATEIEKTKRGLSLEKRCRFSLNWNTVQSLSHIRSYRSWISIWFIWLESLDIGLKHSWDSKTQFCCLEVQILATIEKSEFVLQLRHCSVFSP